MGTALTPDNQPTPAELAHRWTDNVTDLANLGPDWVPSKGMYIPEVASREVQRQHQPMLRDVLGYGEAQVHAHNRSHILMVRDTGVDATTVGKPLYEAHVQALVANARGTEVDEKRAQQMEEDIRRELRETYGAERAERLQRAVAEFVQAHPRLRALVATENFGSQPSAKQAFDALIEHVRKEKHL